eukprot:3718952-Rhodomonas_salina.2
MHKTSVGTADIPMGVGVILVEELTPGESRKRSGPYRAAHRRRRAKRQHSPHLEGSSIARLRVSEMLCCEPMCRVRGNA